MGRGPAITQFTKLRSARNFPEISQPQRQPCRAFVQLRGSHGLCHPPFNFGVAASRRASDASWLRVTTCGHRRHASLPSCNHHRQPERIWHAGRISTTVGTNSTIRDASWQFVPSKCTHESPAHLAAKRKISVGLNFSARDRSSSVTGWGVSR
jgi:hypothetical protein